MFNHRGSLLNFPVVFPGKLLSLLIVVAHET